MSVRAAGRDEAGSQRLGSLPGASRRRATLTQQMTQLAALISVQQMSSLNSNLCTQSKALQALHQHRHSHVFVCEGECKMQALAKY